MARAEKICENVRPDLRSQVETLANAVLAMQAKINQQIPVYEQMPLAQTVKVGTGEVMLRQNPAVQEFRATVRDYAMALNNLQDILENNKTETSSGSLKELQEKFKLIS